MFWGTILKQGNSYTIGKTEKLNSPLLHVTNCAATQDCSLISKVNGKDYIICSLKASTSQLLDLYFRED